MRTRASVAGGLGAVLSVALLVAGCTGSQNEDGPTALMREVYPVAAAAPPDGGEVRVVEQGMSVYPGPAEPLGWVFSDEAIAANLDYDVLSWGVVVENTSDWAATYTTVQVTVVDSEGSAVDHGYWTSGAEGAQTIVVLLPGQRYGFGHTGSLDAPGRNPDLPYREPADLIVTVVRTDWLPLNARDIEFAEATASGVTTALEPSRISSTPDFSVNFQVNSAYSELRAMTATAVFRNSAGEIIGGTDKWTDDLLGPSPFRSVRPGRSVQDIRIENTVPNLDEAHSEVFLDPHTLYCYSTWCACEYDRCRTWQESRPATG